jgi:hypothetical protein
MRRGPDPEGVGGSGPWVRVFANRPSPPALTSRIGAAAHAAPWLFDAAPQSRDRVRNDLGVFLGGQWHTFDARNNTPRIGRVLIARGRDAADVALSNTFGPATLTSFRVWTDEVPAG